MRFISIISASRRSKSKVRTIHLWTGLIWVFPVLILFAFLGLFKASGAWAEFFYYKSVYYIENKSNEKLSAEIALLQKSIDDFQQKMTGWFSFEDKTRLLFGMKEVVAEEREQGTGGVSAPFEENLWREKKDLKGLFNLYREINLLQRQLEFENYQFENVKEFITKQYHYWDHYPSLWPCRGRITSSFGYRVHPIVGYTCMHEGLDIAAPSGEPIVASANGVVQYRGFSGRYGNLLILRHGLYQTVYGHLQQMLVREGQMVQRGDLIGYVGRTGMTTGPHLHYEIRKSEKVLNPMQYILSDEVVVD
jgi:murein DD-endopeptidase MepM/ murein hydrolase activator NlpD